MTEGNRDKKCCLLFCFFVFYFGFYSLLAVLIIKGGEGVARALLLHWRRLLLLRLPLYLYLWLEALLPLDLRASRRRRERPELLHDGHGQSRLLREHLVEEANARGVIDSIALVILVHDVAPRPLVSHQLAADGVCAQDGVEGGEGAQVVLRGDLLRRDLGDSARRRHSVYLGATICQLACFW